MKKILIIQDTIRHYRKPIYNELAKYYEVTVLHSGGKSVGNKDVYKEIIADIRKVGSFFFQTKVLSTVRNCDHDVIVVMFDLHWVMNLAAVFLSTKKRFLFWGHRYSKNIVGNKIRDLLIKFSDGVVLYSDAEIDQLVAAGLSKTKIFIAPNTVDVSNHLDGSSFQKNSFIYVGRAQERKKIDVLIRAFAEAYVHLPVDTKINIVGGGQENKKLKVLAEDLNIGKHVIFRGEILEDEELKPLFHSAYAYISPGPVGLGVLQSFAYGVPVITGRFEKHGPEFANLSNHENALIFETFDDLKEILIKLCKDKNLSPMLGKNAYKHYVQERTIEKMVEGFKEAIENTRKVE